MDFESNRGGLLDSIMSLQYNPHLLSISKDHIICLLKYTDKVNELGAAAFSCREEYEEFAASKFFMDKVLPSLQKVSNPDAEEGELSSDDEDHTESPPLVVYPLTKYELTRQSFAFWGVSSAGEVYDAKVVAVGESIYRLEILNKSEEKGTLNVFSVNAFMMKESIDETLKVDDLVRVAMMGYYSRDGDFQVKVTANSSEMEELENKTLGKIPMSEVVRPSGNGSNVRWGQIFPNEIMDKNPENSLEIMSLLGIDPYKPYTFLPGVKSSKIKTERMGVKELSEKEEDAIDALKTAIHFKEVGELKVAMEYVNKSIELNPKYSSAYAIRAALIFKQLDDVNEEDVNEEVIMQGVNDCQKSIELNPYDHIAHKEVSDLLVECALKLSKDEFFSESKICVEAALAFFENKEAKALYSTLQSLMDVTSNQ